VTIWFDEDEHERVAAAAERLIPADPASGAPGARAGGVADYVDQLLGAFSFDPPRIFAGGPFSGRHGGADGFSTFLPLGPLEELAWRTRIEGSNGIAEREINGPTVGWQQRYREALAALGADFERQPPDEQDARLDALPEFKALLYEHACEAMYGDPVYGGNRDLVAWTFIDFRGDTVPRGWTDAEVSNP
jgi:hypothetical protein